MDCDPVIGALKMIVTERPAGSTFSASRDLLEDKISASINHCSCLGPTEMH